MIPILFASSVAVLPAVVAGIAPPSGRVLHLAAAAFSHGQPLYYPLLALAILFFSFL